MPWCDTCSRFWPDAQLTEVGACPECDAVVGDPPRTPWHLKLLVLAVVVYLGWRLIQGMDWLLGRI
jgi:hypothetical protein